MKSTAKILMLLLIAIAVIAAIPFGAVADSADGWTTDSDGAVRYYRNGEYLTGVQTIGNFTYEFSESGSYLGVYDGHTNIGRADTQLEAAYETGLKALVSNGGKVYTYTTYDSSDTYTSGQYTTNTPATGSLPSSDFYTKVAGIYQGGRAQSVQRDTAFELVRRGDGSAIHVVSSKTATTHSYLNFYLNNHTPGSELVLEVEYKLGEGIKKSTSLFQLIDRNNADTNTNYMPNLLTMNGNGGVYLASDSGSLIAVLSTKEYTRLSVAIHPSTNTMDVYVNGLLIVDEAVFLTDSHYNAMNFQVDELRTAQFSNEENIGSIYVDNMAAYNAPAPINTVTAEPRNGLMLEGGVLRFYKDNRIALGNNTVNGTVGGYTFNAEKLHFGTADGDGSYPLGSVANIIVNGQISSSAVVPGNIFVAPDAVTPDNGVFGGWEITDGSKVTLLSPGQLYMMSGDITCRAVEMKIEVLEGASLKTTTSDSATLRFMAKLSRP
ncbi:MAG: hypothetical protein IKB34_08430, partial [Clostridia bacterium]|nr:hypothetical protein [Clostridia bacterium]